MARIEGFRVKNYRILRDVTLGKLSEMQSARPLTPLTVVIGKNGSGKSTLFDCFGFLADCLSYGVEEACDRQGRGGFERILSSGSPAPIHFEIYYRESSEERPISYELSIDLDRNRRPYVASEKLRQRRKGQKRGRPFPFLKLESGKGEAWTGESYETEDTANKVTVELTDPRQLGIATLGTLKEHPRIAKFRNFIRNWYLSYFSPDSARSLPLAGPQKHLDRYGDNLGNVIQYMEREYPERFEHIKTNIAAKIPGIEKISTERSKDGRLLIQFNDKGFKDPFYAQQMSDGTLKMFAYLILLEDPEPPPFLCIEEPENGLYHKLLESLAKEFREHVTLKGYSQIFVTTHQPYFVDALDPEETWILEKQPGGFVTISRASDDPKIKAMVEEGIPLGSLWYSDHFDKR